MDGATRNQIIDWANDLIDLSRRNPSLDARLFDPAMPRPTRSSLALVQPEPARILELLQRGKRLDFHLPAERPLAPPPTEWPPGAAEALADHPFVEPMAEDGELEELPHPGDEPRGEGSTEPEASSEPLGVGEEPIEPPDGGLALTGAPSSDPAPTGPSGGLAGLRRLLLGGVPAAERPEGGQASGASAAVPSPPRVDDPSGSLLVTDRPDRLDVEVTLRALARQADADQLDKGLRTLYCCFGLLEWRESDHDREVLRAPLVFVPARLERGSVRAPYRLVRADGEPILNPSLRARLDRDFAIALPELDDADAFDAEALAATLEAVRAACSGHPWRVRDDVMLKRATFHKEAMYRDLRDNLERVADHRIVHALADPAAADLDLGEIESDEQQMDEVAPPEQAHLILDADATQRRAVHTAVRGTSFVMDGPPGSGKSQTIANMIAELVAAGRSVLFVSEKVAALEVVANRLRELGLDQLLFELHSEKATRRQVAAALGHALDNAPVARPRLDPGDLEHARQLRLRLSRYAAAVNAVRQPLGRSAHWALGRLAQLSDVPVVAPPDGIGEELSLTDVVDLQDRFEQLAAVWAPAEDPDEFVWRGLTGAAARPGAEEDLRRLLDDLARILAEAQDQGDALAYEAGLPTPDRVADARRLVAACDHCREQPATEASWWTMPELAELGGRIERLRELAGRHEQATEALVAYAGDHWSALPDDGAERLTAALRGLGELAPAPPVARLDRVRVDELLALARETAALAAELRAEGGQLAAALGVAERERTVAEVRRLALVAERSAAVVRPEPAWAVRAVATQVEQAVAELAPLAEEYRRRRAAVAETFDDRVYELDLRALVARFEHLHRGWRKLGSGWWADKQAVAAVSRSGSATAAVCARLPEALAVAELGERLDRAEAGVRELLGHFHAPRASDLDGARKALATLRFAAEQLGADYHPDAVAAQLAGPAPEDPTLAGRAERLRDRLERWQRSFRELVGADAGELDPDALDAWAAHAGELLAAMRELLVTVERAAGKAARAAGAVTVERAGWLLAQVAEVRATEAELAAAEAADRELLGPWYGGFATPWTELDAAVAWTAELRARNGGPLPAAAVERLRGKPAPDPGALEERLDQTAVRAGELADWFEPERGAELRDELGGHLADAAALVRTMIERLGQIDLWYAHVRQVVDLRELGWKAPLDRCAAERVPAGRLRDTLERAMYAAWVEAVTAADPVLRSARPEALDSAVTRFRELDRRLVEEAAEHVVEAYLEGRPTTTVGQAGVIRHQARLQRRHLPVRTLLERTAEVVTSLKPSFMMSPLTVSQFLPPSFTFDVVIFDEASQIGPADAVNCIYRGRQLVVAGDERQLPPTSFFQVGAVEETVGPEAEEQERFDEFESILDLCKGTAGLPTLPLRWHYRSRHESLIAFSNHRFYDGNLVTFPSAVAERDDLGVHLYLVDGVYRRGGPRDNPVEAAAVAERVAHHAARPERPSIGVVAFSQAQAEAIENAIEQLLRGRPDLEEALTGDRLNRFFVKNLESVQGDERDVMIFSVGYGPDESGRLTLNFGPLNEEGGWRRLNVAVTRARQRVEVVASFSARDLDGRGGASRGVRELQRYLGFAEHGLGALGVDLGRPGADPSSPLEQSVAEVLRGWGYQVVPHVGTAGYRVDLGVRHPEEPGRFVLGVECDGAAYHSSRVARDRDRLRQEVLGGLGWRLHRIWGPAWYRDRAGQEARLRAVLDDALAARGQAAADARPYRGERPTVAVALDEPPAWAVPYRACRLEPEPGKGSPSDQSERHRLQALVQAIVRSEAPIRGGLVARRVGQVWPCTLSTRVRAAVDEAVAAQVRRGWCTIDDGDVVRVPGGAAEQAVRVPDPRDPQTRREIAEIPPHELRIAVRQLLGDARAADDEELLTRVRELFGFERTGPRMRAALEEALRGLVDSGAVVRGPDGLLRAEPPE